MVVAKIRPLQVGHGSSSPKADAPGPYEDIKGDLRVWVSPPHDTDGAVLINAGTTSEWVDIELSPDGVRALIVALHASLETYP